MVNLGDSEPLPPFGWTPKPYDVDKRTSTYRGEKWLADQASFLMEMMKFQPNIRKEVYRKGSTGFQPFKNTATGTTTDFQAEDGDRFAGPQGNAFYDFASNQDYQEYLDSLLDSPPASNQSDPASEPISKKSWKDYLQRVKLYDDQYYGLYGVNERHFAPYHHDTNNTSFGISHFFGNEGNKYTIQGFSAGAAVSENVKLGKKTQIYDFFMNFWDFSGSYKDYFNGPGLAAGRNPIVGDDILKASFFVHPGDKDLRDQNSYRYDLKYDYATKLEIPDSFVNRKYDAIPIYKPQPTSWGPSYFNSINGGKNVSQMTWDDFMHFYPTDFTNSFFGRNPNILMNDEIPSLTGYDRPNLANADPTKTHFREAVDYFEENGYTSSRGKAYQIAADQKNYEIVSRAGFYDLMMDPDAPWNTSLAGDKGDGWWAQRPDSGRNGNSRITDTQFENMKAALYIVILAVEAKRRYLHSMTQWYGPGTQFQGFGANFDPGSGFDGTAVLRNGLGGSTGPGTYVRGADRKMIDYFTSWYGENTRDWKTGIKTNGDNKYWRMAEAPQFRAAFNDLFMTAGHEMGAFLNVFSGTNVNFIYSPVERDVSTRLTAWLKEQFVLLMNPANVQGTTLEHIHPEKNEQDLASQRFDEFLVTDKPVSYEDVVGVVSGVEQDVTLNRQLVSKENKFANNATLTRQGNATISWTGWKAKDTMLSDHDSSIVSRVDQYIDASTLPAGLKESLRTDIINDYKADLGSDFEHYTHSVTGTGGSAALTGLGSSKDNATSGVIDFATYNEKGRHYLYMPSGRSYTYSQPITVKRSLKLEYRWKNGAPDEGEEGEIERRWTYYDYHYEGDTHEGAWGISSWSPGTELPPTPQTGEYDAPRTIEHRINWDSNDRFNDGYTDRSITEKYELKANISYEFYQDVTGDSLIRDEDKEIWTKGHSIEVVRSSSATDGNGSLSISGSDIKTEVVYKDATAFREAYEDFQANSAKPYDKMSLATYRMERDYATRGALAIDPYIDPTRWAHQWFRKQTELKNVLGLDGDPELKRIYNGGAVAELFREFRLIDDTASTGGDFGDWKGDGIEEGFDSDENPVATANFNLMMNDRIGTKQKLGTDGKGIGAWHLSVGNLLNGAPDDTSIDGNQASGRQSSWGENWIHQYTGWSAATIRAQQALWGNSVEFQGSPSQEVWGLRVAYLVRSASTYGVNQIVSATAVSRVRYAQYEHDVEEYEMNQQKKMQQKVSERRNDNERRAEYRAMIAKSNQDKMRKNSRVQKTLLREEKNRNAAKQKARSSKTRKSE